MAPSFTVSEDKIIKIPLRTLWFFLGLTATCALAYGPLRNTDNNLDHRIISAVSDISDLKKTQNQDHDLIVEMHTILREMNRESRHPVGVSP